MPSATDPARAAVLEGIGVHVPPRVVSNDDLTTFLDTNDAWIRSRTGIEERRVADDDVATAELAVEAGGRALKSAGGGRVDAIVLATMTPDRLCPSTAPEVAARLDHPGITAMDVGAACSGFVYALATAAGFIAVGVADRVLVIGAETMYRFMSPEDRGTKVLFGDGAGAVVLRAGTPDELGAVGPFDLGADGGGSEMLHIAAGGSRLQGNRPEVTDRDFYLRMDGKQVYRQAVRQMVESSQAVLAAAGWAVTDVDRLIAHQANIRIIDAVADRLALPADRRFTNLQRYGNTSAASIPLALAEADLAAGDKILMTAFGSGLTWGSAVMTWPEVTIG